MKIKSKGKSKGKSKIKYISGIIMMKIKLTSRNFEKLQRFSALSIKSEQISLIVNCLYSFFAAQQYTDGALGLPPSP